MYFDRSLWLLIASSQLACSLSVQQVLPPILLEAGTLGPNIMDEIIFNLTSSSSPSWLETSPSGQDNTALFRRDVAVSQQKNPPNGRSYPGVEWDETCSDEQIDTIRQALGDAYILAQAAQQTMEELKKDFDTTTKAYLEDKALQAMGSLNQVQADVVLRLAPMIRKFFARDGPGVGSTWTRIINDQLDVWRRVTANMAEPDSNGRVNAPDRILRMACNLGGTNADGSEADEIQDENNKNLCHDPSNPDEDTQAVSLQKDTAHNDRRTYRGLNAAVINFCRDFFFLHGTTTPRPSDFQKQQDFETQPAGEGGFKNIDLSVLDTTGRIVLHEIFHQSWAKDLLGGADDKIGYKAMADAAGFGYSKTSTLPDAWAWMGVWARWMKFKELLTCDLYPANA